MKRLKLLNAFFLLLLLGAVFEFNVVNLTEVSAVPTSPYMMVLPEKTADPSITPGMNYTVSIYTDYSGNDTWGWQFELYYNPDILKGGINTTDVWTGNGATRLFNATRIPVALDSERIFLDQVLMIRNVNYTIEYATGEITFTTAPSSGIEVKAIYLGNGVVNGNLVTLDKNETAVFVPGQGFDNAVGRLRLVGAFYDSSNPPPYTTTGPGTFANVTFTVVGTGFSNISIGKDSRLKGYNLTTIAPYNIINPNLQPDHIGHGYFDNIPDLHDIAVTDLRATPATPNLGDQVQINVTVRNEGNYSEDFNVAVYANETLIDTKPAQLDRGTKTTLVYNFNTTGKITGNYVINATAFATQDDDLNDNTMTTIMPLTANHDVAVVNLEVPSEGIINSLVPINVTVANQGSFDENITLTISYQPRMSFPPPPTVISSTNFTLAMHTTSELFSVNWNTTGLDVRSYTINATATISLDELPSDNTLTEVISLTFGKDVAITDISSTSVVFIGDPASINVTVRNLGGLDQDVVVVRASNTTDVIGSQEISLLVGESKIVYFTWDTHGVAPGLSYIQIEVVVDVDENEDNNQATAVIIVQTPTGHIAGTVKDSVTENPIEGVTVTANGYSDVTDALGQYDIANVPEGTYVVTASKNGYETSTSQNVNVIRTQTTIMNFTLTQLPTNGYIAGSVLDASTGNPIEGATVRAGDYSASTNATGNYSIELPAGTYTVEVSIDGYEDSSKSGVSVTAGAITPLDFELTMIQQPNIAPYVIAAAVAVIVVAALVAYVRSRKGKQS
jgi:hypothetical protein